jgi:ABC-type dipeptide/oligopeptide/nickel transport system permease subunit
MINNVGFSTAKSMFSRAKRKKKKEGMWMQSVERLSYDRVAMIGFAGLVFFVLLAIFGPFLTPYSLNEMDLLNMNAGSTWQHPMGTDALGRDCLSRLVYGTRYSLALGVGSSLFSLAIGTIFGSFAGYFGGAAESLIMRICDIMQSIPPMMISIIVSITLGNSIPITILALALGGFPFSTRLTRAQVLSVRKSEYIDAAKCVNCKVSRIMFRHILPNVASPMLLNFTMQIAHMIQLSAGLSVIGLGVQPPTPEWGAMLSAGRNYILTHPHLVIFPGFFIFVLSYCINLFGDGLRDALDPKLKT